MQHVNCWERAAWVLKYARVAFLYGPPETGKSYAGMHSVNGGGLFRVSLTEDTCAAELRGHFVPQGAGAWGWHDGPAIRAWKAGGTLVLDEISHAPPDVLSLMLLLTERPESARCMLPSGEEVRPAPGFRCVLTSNETPDRLHPALRSRIEACVEITEPNPEGYRALPDRFQDAARRSWVGEPARRLGLRRWHAFSAMIERGASLAQSASLAFGPVLGAEIAVSLEVR